MIERVDIPPRSMRPRQPAFQQSPFFRGAVGAADAGPGTGGSQFFIMHSRAPHLERRYTWIGWVTGGMDVVDRLQVGDIIISSEANPSLSR